MILLRPRGPGAVEPLLPIEKKLIGWSLTIGLVLLVGLALFNHFVPVTF